MHDTSTPPLGHQTTAPAADKFDAHALTRPAPVLLWYYVMISAMSVIGFPILMPQFYFRYHTLRYKFDEDGISLSWGILFKREIQLTYRRIQDIHVTRNILQRWLGLSNIAIQTASGSTGAEMVIEGVMEADALRDFLYRKMRGARGDIEMTTVGAAPLSTEPDEALILLQQIRDEVRALTSSKRDGQTGATL